MATVSLGSKAGRWVMVSSAGLTLELQFGADNEKVGYSWTTTPTDNGQIEGFPARLINTIKETGISKTVNGKSYSNVIHTQSDLQYDLGGGYQAAGTYNFYLAKGVGLIELTLDVDGSNYETETLTSYSVK
jgi:hypothetical protein